MCHVSLHDGFSAANADDVKPPRARVHVFGECRGQSLPGPSQAERVCEDAHTVYMHASSTDQRSRLVHAPLLFDVRPIGLADGSARCHSRVELRTPTAWQ